MHSAAEARRRVGLVPLGRKRRINPLLRFFEEKETAMPVLYVMGEEDHMFLPAVRRIIEKQKNCFLNVVEGAGHVCNIDRPLLFNRYVITFLRSQAVVLA